jgi:hypothetical protein
MPEIRPEQWIIDLIDRATCLRGRYLTSYAQCEFLLADLSVKVDGRFRYAIKQRVNAAKIMAAVEGPLNRYADDFLPLIEGISAWSERRHWFAHGFVTLIRDPKDQVVFEFRRYEEQGDELILLAWTASIDALQDAADSINYYCKAFVALHQRIYSELGIED